MSKKTIRLTESDLKRYISKVVSEQNVPQQPQVQRPQVQQQPVNESQLINENISNDIDEYRMMSRRVAQQLEYFEDMVKKGDIKRANEEKGGVIRHITKLEYILESLKRKLR